MGVAVWAGGREGGTRPPSTDAAVFLRGIVSRIAQNDYDAHITPDHISTEQLTAEMDRALSLLKENHGHVDAVTAALAENERLVADDLRKILPPVVSVLTRGG